MTNIDERPSCDDCGEYADECTCDPLSNLIGEVNSVIDRLEQIAGGVSNGLVFHSCIGRLRMAVEKAEKGVKE